MHSFAPLVFILASVIQADAPAPDFSSPRAAAKSFYSAVDIGDVPTIRAAMLAEDESARALVDAFTDVIVASRKLASAARDKFGAPGDALGMTAIPKEEAAQIERAAEKIDGDTATFEIPGRAVPMKFRRSAGGWRLIVTDFAGAAPANISKQTNLLTQLAQLLNDTAADIGSGKLASAEQAQASFQDRFNEVMIKGASTQPAAK